MAQAGTSPDAQSDAGGLAIVPAKKRAKANAVALDQASRWQPSHTFSNMSLHSCLVSHSVSAFEVKKTDDEVLDQTPASPSPVPSSEIYDVPVVLKAGARCIVLLFWH